MEIKLSESLVLTGNWTRSFSSLVYRWPSLPCPVITVESKVLIKGDKRETPVSFRDTSPSNDCWKYCDWESYTENSLIISYKYRHEELETTPVFSNLPVHFTSKTKSSDPYPELWRKGRSSVYWPRTTEVRRTKFPSKRPQINKLLTKNCSQISDRYFEIIHVRLRSTEERTSRGRR